MARDAAGVRLRFDECHYCCLVHFGCISQLAAALDECSPRGLGTLFSISEVAQRRARLVVGWVTAFLLVRSAACCLQVSGQMK